MNDKQLPTRTNRSMFKPPRHRDAYASIRGYVFQIDHTIHRWLSLRTDEVLELERGEDIDLVRQLLSADGTPESESRLLEQIKCRERTITLRSPAASEALANFHDHRVRNRNVDLQFCFLTNAHVACEQLSPFPNGLAGIELWEQVRTRAVADDDATAAAGLLQEFLRGLPKPDRFSKSVWSAWKTFLNNATPGEFAEFVGCFNWSVGHQGAEAIPAALLDKACSLGLASDTGEAQVVCDCLFVHVARLLGTAGVKRLTADDRCLALQQLSLSVVQREMLAQLRAMVALQTDRIDRLEAALTTVGAQVETIVFGRTPAERIGTAAQPPDVSFPHPVPRLSPRPRVVDRVRKLLATRHWVAIHGGPHTGKSQLALQVATADVAARGWIRFHHSQPLDEAKNVLDSALACLAGCRPSTTLARQYSALLSRIGAGSLIVLDDIPRMASDDRLAECFIHLARAASQSRVMLLSTSQFETPFRIRHELSDDCFSEYSMPPFSDGEARALFRAYGAPTSLLAKQRLRFLNGRAFGHPLLLTATADFLASRNWKYRHSELEALLRGDHAERIMPDVIDRLSRTLDTLPRELLYRLTLPLGSFDRTDAVALAKVNPQVPRPREHLNALLGAWVQRDTNVRFAVSPLVKSLGSTELSEEVRTACYRTLANLITDRASMSQVDADRAILYLLEASDGHAAAMLYVLILRAAIAERNSSLVVHSIDKWRHTPLPQTLSVSEQLFVRAYQLAAFSKHGLGTHFLAKDVDELLQQASDKDGWAIVTLAVQALGHWRRSAPAKVLRYVRRAIDLGVIYGPDGKEVTFERVSLRDMLWMLVTDLTTREMLHEWIDAVERVPSSCHATFWESNLAREGVWLVPNRLYLTECEKPKAEQDWETVLQTLSELLARSRRLRQPRLEAAFAVSTIQILGERKLFDRVGDIAQTTLDQWPTYPDVQCKVRSAWGRVWAYERRPDIALPLLDTALAEPDCLGDHEQLRCLLAASHCAPDHEFKYITRARDLAETSPRIPAGEAARALGEYALACFEVEGGQGGAITAFRAWSQAIKRFYDTEAKDRLWRDMFVLLAHTTSHLTVLACDGSLMTQTIEGEVSVPPRRGLLLKDYMPEREACYRRGGESGLLWMMAQYASAASEPEDALEWTRTALAESRSSGAVFIHAACGRDAVPELLTSGLYEDALEAGVLGGRAMVVQSEMGPLTRENFDGLGLDLRAEFRKLATEKRQKGDVFAFICAILPAAMWIVRVCLTDRESGSGAARRVSAVCRQLSTDQGSDGDLWVIAADLLDFAEADHGNAGEILDLTKRIVGQDERSSAVKVLAYIVATGHASVEEAIHLQLACSELLLKWFGPKTSVHSLILLPYVESYWRHAAAKCRFALRAPDSTVAAIERALDVPKERRVQAILCAAAGGFYVRDMQEVIHKMRISAEKSA